MVPLVPLWWTCIPTCVSAWVRGCVGVWVGVWVCGRAGRPWDDGGWRTHRLCPVWLRLRGRTKT